MTTPTSPAFALLDALERELPDAPELHQLRQRLTDEYHARIAELQAERDDLGSRPVRRFRITPDRIIEARQLHEQLGNVDLVARALGISRAQTYRLLRAPL